MNERQTRGNGPLATLWIMGVLFTVGGFVARSNLMKSAQSEARIDEMFENLRSGAVIDVEPDYTQANYALWIALLGVFLLVIAVTVQAVRHK